MKRTLTVIAVLLILLITGSCRATTEPEGYIKGLIEEGKRFNNHLYYWETLDGKTAVYRIAETSSDISTIIHDLEGVRDLKSSRNAVYILHDNARGNLAVTRLEGNRAMTTDAPLDIDITSWNKYGVWDVSHDDKVFIAGVDDNDRWHIVEVVYTREEAERTFKESEVLVPEISYEQNAWYESDDPIGMLNTSNDGDVLALTMPSPANPDQYALYFLSNPGESAILVDEGPVYELGGFSPDKSTFTATIEDSLRVDLYKISTETLSVRPITRVATGFHVKHPRWHPNGKYIIYSTDYTTEFMSDSTPLSGDQLFLYSLISNNDRRLTAFQGQSLWVDFSPQGDFLLYSSVSGVVARTGRGIPDNPDEVDEEDEGLETWRMNYVPWVEDDFVTGNVRILNSDEVESIVSWTHGANVDIRFVWGPEMVGL